ncbi:hypothetical protein [Stackebrandtia nassauensis]|uniref:Uncharacterized protein n=1 Tax=Stackebrandtia nassauensis (strain DSM 44728 / CIP 108903 / NRRL B-16338 / NBRC 102104 / LLR-40K-21) TaxID=446470 RepID=D3PX63_STANL|nr:hypothetical protein [Stackebrandtia nassauensis]ADD41326.1 hypothetical protein Snas_1623 [Stackebrandtia nassauensis DSM 44728]
MITRILDGAFRTSLLLFLLGGAIVVATQAVGLVGGNGPLVEGAVTWVGTPTYVLAGLAGLLGFVLSYLKGWDTSD